MTLCHPAEKGGDGIVKCQKYQIAALIKVSILKATYSVSVGSVEGVHDGIAATEVQVARISTANRTAPIAADGTKIAERTIAEAAVARQRQFKRRGKSAGCVVL